MNATGNNQVRGKEYSITFLLLCGGSGATKYETFRPKLDESQWNMRRDALVRCITCSIFGHNSNGKFKNRLILVFDEDLSYIELRKRNNCSIIPTERNIIHGLRTVMKRAMTQNQSSLSTSLNLDGIEMKCTRSNQIFTETPKQDTILSKRELLVYLQENASIEFLRKHKLNNNLNSVLKKVNQKTLAQAYQEFFNNQQKDSNIKNEYQEELTKVLILTLQSQQDNSIVVFLHETCQYELSCFHSTTSTCNKSSLFQNVIFFLGTVRDVQDNEYKALQKACTTLQIPLIGCHIGNTIEFTSKIISCIQFHYSILDKTFCSCVSNLYQLLHKNHKLGLESYNQKKNIQQKVDKHKVTTTLHYCCHVPITTNDIVTDISRRTYILWSMVRICVCAMWRSRLMSTNSTASNFFQKVSFVFQDSSVLTLYQEEFVTQMAQQHHAAPTEYQILTQILHTLKSCQQELPSIKTFVKTLEKDVRSCYFTHVLNLYCQNKENSSNLIDAIYHHDAFSYTEREESQYIVCLFAIEEKEHKIEKVRKKLLSKFEKCGFSIMHDTWALNSIDRAGILITMLQHFHSQNELYPAIKYILNKKRKSSIDYKPKNKKLK